MVSSPFALPATAWLTMLLTVTSAARLPAPLLARQSQDSLLSTSSSSTPVTPSPAPTGALAPWVSVDESGTPKTITPVLTTISGTPTTLSPAPFTVTTQTRADAKPTTTTTGSGAPQATGPSGSGGGAFAICTNTDPAALAPFCSPENNATLHPGVTHYVTWNPTFFPPNTTVRVIGFYDSPTPGSDLDEAFSSDLIPAAWGFYQWAVTSTLYTTPPHLHPAGVNITLRIAALPPSGPRTFHPGPRLLVAPKPTPPPVKTGPPTGPALYIGLPCVLAFIVLVVGGTCWWNRRERRIGVGNVMGRGRRGYGVGKSRRERVKGGIKLEDAPARGRGMERGRRGYTDQPSVGTGGGDGWGQGEWRGGPMGGAPRRDSDALGSLAGSPVRGGGGGGGGNVFREELGRQRETREFMEGLEKRKY